MKSFVIIGNSAAGIACAEEIRKSDKSSSITIITDEKGAAYSRCLLSYFISGQIGGNEMLYKNDDFYELNNIKLMDGTKAVSIDPSGKKVNIGGGSVSYDKLLISTGANPNNQYTIPAGCEGIHTLRYIDDALKINEKLNGVKNAVVLGSGLIGMKIAYAVYKKGINVTIIAKSGHILPQMLDKESSSFLNSIISSKNNSGSSGLGGALVKIITKLDADGFIFKNNMVCGVKLKNGETINCDMVIVGKGVKPNIELGITCGLEANYGIITDSKMKTSDNDIYAAGDAAETVDLITGERGIKALWTAAVEQGKIAGKNMLGINADYLGSTLMNSVECFGIPCISSGSLNANDSEIYDYRPENKTSLRRIFVNGGRIRGFITIGDIAFSGILNGLLKDKKNVSEIKGMFGSGRLSRSDLLSCSGEETIISLMSNRFDE